MISAPSSQALLARTALRGARIAAAAKPTARVTSAFVISSSASQPSRSFTVSSIPRQEVAAIPTVADDAAQQPFVIPTSGRKKRGKPTTEADKAKLLLKWGWFEPNARKSRQLANALTRGFAFPEWLRPTYDLVKAFRSARARLWSPTAEDIRTFAPDATFSDPQQWIDEQIEAYRSKFEAADAKVSAAKKESIDYISKVEMWDMMDYEQQVDFALRSVWDSMSEEQRSAALLRTRYDSIRKLGWRQGYSSGYPRPEGESSHLPSKLGAEGDEGWAAFRELQKAEEADAWVAWQNLSPEERVAEEKAAWKLRDRSQVYIDDSEDSLILTSPSPRWYPVPERAGELTFLPNTIIKLVKNHTPEGAEYDPFKATFRVPLSMHKHALRSYLLSIYGLKTTWARSSIYRSPVTRDNRTGKKISGRGRTYKKVEVGLLEPFLFPEISPEFQKQHLLTSELDYERSRVYLKMTKTTRWRGKKSTDQYEQEITNRDEVTYHNLDPLSSEGIKGDDKKDGEKFPRFMVKTKGLPSAKHGKILELLAKERKEKDERIQAMVDQFKRDAAVSAKSEA
ncbi:uncharacterized protein UTRI_04799_B [Ustilago trichophora]|uniref:Large ribosomal subunit protein uL23m n=1 Tax=Ustilago trichophora TaxID=86804 RepID=A0A5C3EGS0_9BASI|nr:uncharacterized protein UTRI_04799_B [Ustilago trichophora]